MSTTPEILQLIIDLVGGGSDIVTKAEHKPLLDALTNSLLNKETDSNLLGLLNHDPARSYKNLEGAFKDGQLWQANQAIAPEAFNIEKWDQITGTVALSDYQIDEWEDDFPSGLGTGYSEDQQAVRDDRLWSSDSDSNTDDPLVSGWTEISANDGNFGNNWVVGRYKQDQVITDLASHKLYYLAVATPTAPFFNSVDFDAELINNDWVEFNNHASPGQATEILAGILKIATQAITDAGTNDTDAVTALKLKVLLNTIGLNTILSINPSTGGISIEVADGDNVSLGSTSLLKWNDDVKIGYDGALELYGVEAGVIAYLNDGGLLALFSNGAVMPGIQFASSATTFVTKLIAIEPTAARTWTLPDKTGTIAMLSDIPAVPPAPLLMASGVKVSGDFSGNPKIATVTFVKPFADANYSISVIGIDSRAWSIQSVAAGSFVINSNSNGALSGDVHWTAIKHGETT